MIGASRLRISAAMDSAVCPLGMRCSNGSRMAHICPELVEGLNVMPSMPEYTDAEETPGVSSTMGTTRCTMASVRARLLPGGMVMEMVIVD